MLKTLFVTGTDTDCGKTTTSHLILQGLQRKGLLTFGFKPVASGAHAVHETLAPAFTSDGLTDTADCAPPPARLVNEDALCLRQASSIRLPYVLINPYCFLPPIAPHIAAEYAGQRISVAQLRDKFGAFKRAVKEHTQDQDAVIVVEGAGGWAVPLNESASIADLAVAEAMPVVLVVAMKLGCINHALLTAQAIAAQGGVLVGWVANQVTAKQMAYHAETLAHLGERICAPLLAEVPYLVSEQRTQWNLPPYAVQQLLTAIDCNQNYRPHRTYANE